MIAPAFQGEAVGALSHLCQLLTFLKNPFKLRIKVRSPQTKSIQGDMFRKYFIMICKNLFAGVMKYSE